MSDCDDIVKEFLVESHENLDRLDRDLVELEKNPSEREILASIFRTIHTIKGTSGFLGFGKLEAVAHVGESLLARLRDGELKLNPQLTTALLALVDAVRQMLASIESSGNEGERNDQELIATLTNLMQGDDQEGLQSPSVSERAPKPAAARPCAPVPPENIGEILINRGITAADEVSVAIAKQSAGDPRRVGEILVEHGTAKPQDVLEALRVQQAHGQTASESTIRVDVGLLDQLMNLVGELVLARNQILQFTKRTEDTTLVTAGQRLNLIASELQESVMKTRMQPIGSIWSRFPRTVRDVALSCGKRVRIEMEGQETELDKTLIEAIKDPMTHLVRNAIDHGVERPEVRALAGKSPEGLLQMRAYHEGGQVNIEISDDGAGLDLRKVIHKAVEKGLISSDQAGRLSEREAANLIFLPGLSTAEKVTNVSGRGVGMDVVKTNIERIGGTVDVQSVTGKGTTVKVKIPLTLAIVPALIVTSGGDRFAIPQVALTELVSIDSSQAKGGVETVQGAPVYRLRGRLLPLVDLNRELHLSERENSCGAVSIVVLHAEDREFGLVVDEINDTEEIVVKPLRKQLKSVKVFAGASIMGDGRVALILDVLGLAQRANVIGESRDAALRQDTGVQQGGDARQTLLLFQSGGDGRMAIPLSSVARLEEFKRNAVERSGRQEVVQYRGHILPLIRVADVVECGSGVGHEDRAVGDSPLQVVVYTEKARSVGLVVDSIVDIVEENVVVERAGARAGVLGSALIQQRVTDLLDVKGVVQAFDPQFYEQRAGA